MALGAEENSRFYVVGFFFVLELKKERVTK